MSTAAGKQLRNHGSHRAGTVISADGTPIAYERSGQGEPAVLVYGALTDRPVAAPLAAALDRSFTVFAYDRRGRGGSGDTAPYAVEREVEDLAAVIAAGGGPAYVYGHSSGAVLTLHAAAHRLPIRKLAVYEPPFMLDDSHPPLPDGFISQLGDLVAAGRRGDAVQAWLSWLMSTPAPSPEAAAQTRRSPWWAQLEELAHTIVYDLAVMGDTLAGTPPPADRWTDLATPTLVMDGGKSPAYLHNAARTLAGRLPHAEHRRFPDADHGVPAEALAPALVQFFAANG